MIRSIRSTVTNPEWRTWALAMGVYGGWAAVTALHMAIPLPLLIVLGGWFVAWQGSLQHETIHRHPTRSDRINALVGGWPLSLWLPYRIYRRSHRQHHGTARPTYPGHDPESRYLDRGERLAFIAASAEATLVGRLLLGPAIGTVRFIVEEIRRAPSEPRGFAADWGFHLAGVAVVWVWLDRVGLPILTYLTCFVVPGQMLSLLRGYAEHRADSQGPSRAATVSAGGPLALLFLNNNLHAAHHSRPDAPWYRLPAIEAMRANRNEPRYSGYAEIVRRFLFRRHDDIVHPDQVMGPSA